MCVFYAVTKNVMILRNSNIVCKWFRANLFSVLKWWPDQNKYYTVPMRYAH